MGTCFWDSLIHQLGTHQLIPPTMNPHNLLALLQSKNVKTTNVFWQETQLSENQMTENLTWVAEYNAARISDSHLGGACDPFLLLVCELYRVTICDMVLNHKIMYVHVSATEDTPILKLNTSSGHVSPG